MLESNLFHSIMVVGKYEFLKTGASHWYGGY